MLGLDFRRETTEETCEVRERDDKQSRKVLQFRLFKSISEEVMKTTCKLFDTGNIKSNANLEQRPERTVLRSMVSDHACSSHFQWP